MKFNFLNLNQSTRDLMVSEIKSDMANNKLYLSKRFNESGIEAYPTMLLQSAINGDEQTLTNDLQSGTYFKEKEKSHDKNQDLIIKDIPETAEQTLAENEFNNYYMRALAIIAIENKTSLEIYRAKDVKNPREQSIAMIGQNIDPAILLNDLRDTKNFKKSTDFPPGPNSGLSVKIK